MANFEQPSQNNPFESCVSLMKDLATRNFKRLFDRVFPEKKIDEGALKSLNKHYSSEFLHRVQKAMRNGSSIEKEFQSDRSSE